MSTIYQVARLARVSPKTAARVLAGDRTRPSNRSRVLKAAQRLGYVRNQQAANLRSGRSGLIGVIVPDIANPQYPIFCRHVHDLALQNGYRMMLANTYGKAQDEASALRIFEANRVEGLILICSEGESDTACDNAIRSLLARGIPVLIGGRPLRGILADQTVVQNAKAVAKAVDYLLRSGRRRLAFLCGAKHLLASRERFQGFKEGLRRHGQGVHDGHVVFQDFTVESGLEQTGLLLRQRPRPDAIVCANDLLAIGALQAALDLGLRVPRDMAVVGFDDIPLAQVVRPRLTTLRQPLERMAQEGMNLLLERIRLKNVSRPRTLAYEPDLVIRDST